MTDSSPTGSSRSGRPLTAEQLRRAYVGRPDAEIAAHLGEVLWVMGQRDEADKIWQDSLKTSPENETLQNTIKRLKK